MKIDEARERLEQFVRGPDFRDPYVFTSDLTADIETLLAAHEIEWDGERSIKYPAAEAVMLMAYYRYNGDRALIVKTSTRGPRYMKRGGQIVAAKNPLRKLDLEGEPYAEWYFVGCQTCHSDAPDEPECPDCGRPLVTYPRYFMSSISRVVYVRFDEPDSGVWVYPDREMGGAGNADLWSQNAQEITPAEAQELREKVLYPRVFVDTTPQGDGMICWVAEKPGVSALIFWASGEVDESVVTADGLAEFSCAHEVTGHFTAGELLAGARRERCSHCKGKGRTQSGTNHMVWPCARCDGTGVEPDTQEVENNVEERLSDIEKRLERLEGNDE